MARMLGLTGDGGGTNLEPLIGRRRKQGNRIMRRREQRAVRREAGAFPDDLSEGRERRIAQYGWETREPGYDWSDCRHGCNGGCVESGSDRCTFVCHGGVVDVDWERTLTYIAEFAQ